MYGGEYARLAKASQRKIKKKFPTQLVFKKNYKMRSMKIGKELELRLLVLEEGGGKG